MKDLLRFYFIENWKAWVALIVASIILDIVGIYEYADVVIYFTFGFYIGGRFLTRKVNLFSVINTLYMED